MNVKAKNIQRLRERTRAGILDCKKALEKANGDMELAVDILRKQGVVKAAKRAKRITAEGLIDIITPAHANKAVILECNCETDFVARGDVFREFTQKLASLSLEQNVECVNKDALLKLPFDGQETVQQAVQALAAKVGENVQLRRINAFVAPEGGMLGCYLHHARVGAIVVLDKPISALAQDIAMHIVAMNPIAISPQDCPADFLNREKEIFTEQAKQSGKPDHIVEKMIQGRLDKLLKEQTLLSQPFIKDVHKTIAELLAVHDAYVLSFVRYELGEGIDK
jgi:elongation factor Ts